MDSPPFVSVIVSLPRHMGHGGKAIRAWLEQSYRRERFELIVMSGATSGAAQDHRVLIGGMDRWIEHPSPHERELFDAGARVAHGDLLVLVESHCVPEPDFLTEMTNYLATDGLAGACAHTIPEYSGWVAKAIAEDFGRQFRLRIRPNDPHKVIIHGFTISRKAYLDVGGYAYQYGIFADAELATRLVAHGYRLGYAPEARMHHHFPTSVSDTLAQCDSYVAGECAFRLSHPESYCDQYFGAPAEWRAHREGIDGQTRILHHLVRHLWRRRLLVDRATMYAVIRAVGERWGSPRLAAYLAFAGAWLRFCLSRLHPDSAQQALQRLCWWRVRVARLEALAPHAEAIHAGSRRADPSPPVIGRRTMDEIHEAELIGFFALEHLDARAFRWSRPIAALRLGLAPGQYRLELETRSVRLLGDARLRIFLNDRALDVSTRADGTIVCSVAPEQFAPIPEQLLIIACKPLRPLADEETRPLGLAIFSLRVALAEHGASAPGSPR